MALVMLGEEQPRVRVEQPVAEPRGEPVVDLDAGADTIEHCSFIRADGLVARAEYLELTQEFRVMGAPSPTLH